jgi:hypothetical protein
MKNIILLIFFTFLLTSISWADDIKMSCPGGVNPNAALEKTTIKKRQIEKDLYEEEYHIKVLNEKDRCFHVPYAKFEYLIDKNHAIYSMRIDGYDTASRLFLFDYGKSEAKWTKMSGIIKTTGEYFNYKDGKNVPRVMPRVIVIKENKI